MFSSCCFGFGAYPSYCLVSAFVCGWLRKALLIGGAVPYSDTSHSCWHTHTHIHTRNNSNSNNNNNTKKNAESGLSSDTTVAVFLSSFFLTMGCHA